MPGGKYSKAEMARALSEREAHLDLLRRARDYCIGHGIGAKRAVRMELFPFTFSPAFSQVHNAVKGKSKRVNNERYATDVLTAGEEVQLAKWIRESARGKDPALDQDISEKIIAMLKARRLDNRRRKQGPGTVPLTEAELRLVTHAGAEVSHTWLSGFVARHPSIEKKKERNAYATRTKKHPRP